MSNAEMESLKKQLEFLIKQNAELRVEVETWKLKYNQLSKGRSRETLAEAPAPKTRIPGTAERPQRFDPSQIDVAEAVLYGIKKNLLPRGTKYED